MDTLVDNKFFLSYNQINMRPRVGLPELLLLFCSFNKVKFNVLSGIEEQLRWYNRRVSVPNYEQYTHSFWLEVV
jgi:hypothetical protein